MLKSKQKSGTMTQKELQNIFNYIIRVISHEAYLFIWGLSLLHLYIITCKSNFQKISAFI